MAHEEVITITLIHWLHVKIDQNKNNNLLSDKIRKFLYAPKIIRKKSYTISVII